LSVDVAALDRHALTIGLATIAAGAAARDRQPDVPPFPYAAIAALHAAGALAGGLDFAAQLTLVRDVARADAGVSRIVDGHLNAVERLTAHAPADLRDAELEAVRRDGLRLGVWGGRPAPGEGAPVRIEGDRLVGVATFCSGAGGVQRAIVLAGDRLAYADVTTRTTVDDAWFGGAGMRASASHRVVFRGAPVIAVLGERGAIAQQPWLARDGVRTAATWAGTADAAADEAIRLLAARAGAPGGIGPLEELAAGRIRAEQRTIALWLADGGACGDAGTLTAPDAAHLRQAIAAAAARLLDEAARATGSHAFATGGGLDRARRDLELFTLQHRLDPIVARAGAAALAQAR
jgi:hypothetical protein